MLMPSLRHNSSSVIILDFASKMKIGNIKKAAAMCKSKTGVLAARLLVLASLRRRMATVGAISHRIHALMAAADSGKDLDKALVPRPRKAKAGGGKPVVLVRRRDATDISDQLTMFHQEDGDGSDGPDWSVHSIFDDENCCYADEYEGDDGDDSELPDLCDDEHDASEPSVMDVIRSNRKIEGLEFNVDDEIDQAAGMFITRFRNRMNGSL